MESTRRNRHQLLILLPLKFLEDHHHLQNKLIRESIRTRYKLFLRTPRQYRLQNFFQSMVSISMIITDMCEFVYFAKGGAISEPVIDCVVPSANLPLNAAAKKGEW